MKTKEEEDWICFECGNIFDKEDLVTEDGIFYCKKCYKEEKKKVEKVFCFICEQFVDMNKTHSIGEIGDGKVICEGCQATKIMEKIIKQS